MTESTNSLVHTNSTAGARFYKCALQVNPHHYSGTFRGQASKGDDISHARAVVDKAIDLGIEVLAITDHNSVSSVPAFRSAARDRSVQIFPGFELSSSEGIHVICIYPPDSELKRLERYLGDFGIHDTNPSADAADESFSSILATVRRQGGISIAAHVSGNRGLFNVLKGQARVRAWKDENLLAVQIPNAVEGLPSNIRQIVKNRDIEYRRTHPPEPELAIATVNAKDVSKPDDLEDRGATCLIKMHDVSIDGLHQAFLDPGSRIRLNLEDGEILPDEHMELVSLGWEGGFLDGVTIHLNSNLNVLIGGRGTGKSTIVESIRAVIGLEPMGEEARKAHAGIVRYVLRSGTKISLHVRVVRPGDHKYLIERTIPNPPLVRDADGELLNLAPIDILPKVEVYGQHEISELAKSPDKRTHLLDRFVESDDELSRRKGSLITELAKNRHLLVDTRIEIESAKEQLSTLPKLEETLKRFQEVGLEDRLQERSLLVREERVLKSVPQRIAPFREAFDLLNRELPIDLAFVSESALADLPGKEILSDLNDVLSKLNKSLGDISEDFKQALERADQGVNKVQTNWDVRSKEVQSKYEQILRALQKSGADGEEFIRLRGRIEELRPVQDRLSMLRKLENEYENQRRNLLAEWEDIKAIQFRSFDLASKEVNKNLNNRVHVEVTPSGNREPLFKVLREEVGGRISETIESLREAPELSLTQFTQACRSGATSLQTIYGITPSQAERIADSGADVFMRIEELDLPPITQIRLNTAALADTPVWQRLEELSTGQKATAVLLLLLLESSAPLIVDQPEDDLDNRFITDGIVPRMREEKQRRQFIFSTHNANIPVLGDAELILGLTAAGEAESGTARIAPEHAGSIDSKIVRELVEEILEGGREAFETRRLKYGF